MVDFDAMLRVSEQEAPTEPRELHGQLSKAHGYGYLRDIQGQVLTAWHQRRHERDLVIKVNTGGGKTIDGLIILQSYLNAGEGPALYVAPSDLLADQVISEAGRLGIATTRNVDGASYLNSEEIGVINVYELVNGRTKFSNRRSPRSRAPIGSVVIDDAHAAIATTRKQLSLNIPRESDAFKALLDLFETDMRTQGSEAFLDVRDDRRGSPAVVPFWAWHSKETQARDILRTLTADKQVLFYSWPAISDVLSLCRVVFSNREVTITPHCPPVDHVTSFMEAMHRIFLTATLADDSVLVTDFGADPTSVRKPVTPITAGDIGERMILAPQEINPHLQLDAIREEIAELSKAYNTVVIVPSQAWALKTWSQFADVLATKSNINDTISRLRKEHVGLVVLVNRYDGIDLPDDACRVLVIDGIPEAFTPEERLDASLAKAETGIDSRQVQRIEQGMGRGVRSNEDHCVVFLLGPRLAQLTVDPRTVPMFSPATQAQLKLSRQVASQVEKQSLASIIDTAKQALGRQESWVRLALTALRNISPQPGRVAAAAVAEREAFLHASSGNVKSAKDTISTAVAAEADESTAGRLLELQAIYTDHIDPALAQQTLALARRKNPNVTRPLGGLVYAPLAAQTPQVTNCVERFTTLYSTPTALVLDFETIISDLSFDELRTDDFEEALRRAGQSIGLTSQRPEQEIGTGPDNLWALGDNRFWVIEAKTGARSTAIGKRDMGQLAESVLWFHDRYDPAAISVPIMIHPAVLAFGDATPIPGMRIITEKTLAAFVTALRAFATGLADSDWTKPEVVERLLRGHGLLASQLEAFTVPQRGRKK